MKRNRHGSDFGGINVAISSVDSASDSVVKCFIYLLIYLITKYVES